jgi:hypothetical protein
MPPYRTILSNEEPANFNPVDYKDDGFVDITGWFDREDQDQ